MINPYIKNTLYNKNNSHNDQIFNINNYYGEQLNNKPHGFGTMYYNNGDTYHGQWFNGNYHLFGITKFNNGDIMYGEYNDGKIINDECVRYICNNGDIYGKIDEINPNLCYYLTYGDISFKINEIHIILFGNNTLFPGESGSCYMGFFDDTRIELFSNNGVMHHSNGEIYIGSFQKFFRHGKGRVIYPNNDTFNGNWHYNIITK